MTYEPTFGGSTFDLVVRVAGELTLDGMTAGRRRLLEDPRLEAGLTALYDYTGADARLLSADDVRELAAVAVSEGLRLRAVAIVAPDDLTFGLSRMFASLADVETPASNRVVVRSVAEAEAWLRQIDATAH